MADADHLSELRFQRELTATSRQRSVRSRGTPPPQRLPVVNSRDIERRPPSASARMSVAPNEIASSVEDNMGMGGYVHIHPNKDADHGGFGIPLMPLVALILAISLTVVLIKSPKMCDNHM